MAGNSNSGRNVVFEYSESALNKEIERYKADYYAGEIERPSWSQFCGRLGVTEQELAAVMQTDGTQSAYSARGRALKRLLTWIRGEMVSGKSWGGQQTTKAIFTLKQDYGDGYNYTNDDTGGKTDTHIHISFGAGDKRGKDAFR